MDWAPIGLALQLFLLAPAAASPWPVDRGGKLMVPTATTAVTVEVDGVQRPATVEPVEPFTADATVVSEQPLIVDGKERGTVQTTLPRSAVRFYRGHLTDEPGSFVFVAVDRDGGKAGGFALTKGKLASVGKARAGLTVAPPGRSLEGDVRRPPARPQREPRASVTVPATAVIAVDTDHELWTKFGSDQATRDYVAAVVAAASSIYQRDVGVTLQVGYLRLWSTTADPWQATDTGAALDEVQAYWRDPSHGLTTVPRAAVNFMSGKVVQGGIAYLDALCDPDYGFGVVQLEGSFDLSAPQAIWDVMVVAHELGHNFGSEHEHCYSPPLDECYNQEPGCYSGPVVCSRGATMSYCHLCPGGLSNIDLVFLGPVVGHILREVSAVDCLTPIGVSTTSTSSVPTTTGPPTTLVSTTTTTAPTTSTTTTTVGGGCKDRGVRCRTTAECCTPLRCIRPWWALRKKCRP